MSCKFCIDEKNLQNLASAVPGDYKLRYCPVCGTDIAQTTLFMQILEEADRSFKDGWRKLFMTAEIQKTKKEGETVKIDGEILEFERLPPKEKKFISKPFELGVDLDKIDISREMEILKKRNRYWPPSEKVFKEGPLTLNVKETEKEKENENG